MRFLRMLTNSLLAGALGAAYLTILVLQLNPQVPLVSIDGRAVVRDARRVLRHPSRRALLRHDGAARIRQPRRVLAGLGERSAAGVAVGGRGRRGGPADVAESARSPRGLRRGCEPALRHRRGGDRRVGGRAAGHRRRALFLRPARQPGRRGAARDRDDWLARAAAWRPGAAAASRRPAPGGRARPPVPLNPSVPHVVLLLLDGASLEFIWPRAAEGRLPNFGRLLDGGASLDLATIRPTQPGPVWAAVATGMYPAKNGVRSAMSYFAAETIVRSICCRIIASRRRWCGSASSGTSRNRPTAWRAPPIWTVLDDYGISSGVVRWPLTYPAEPVRGFLVIDRFHSLFGTMLEFDGRAASPPAIQPLVHDAFVASETPANDPPQTAASLITAPARDVALGRWDQFYARATHDLLADQPVSFTAVRYQGVDTIGHVYLRYAQPRAFGDVSEEERLKYAAVLERYYGYIDSQIGAALERHGARRPAAGRLGIRDAAGQPGQASAGTRPA